MKFQDSVVVVTGANRGLGRALVKEAVARGARRVYAGARQEGSLAGLLKEHPGVVVPLALDVTDEAKLAAAAEVAHDATILVNNAGLLASFGVLTSPLASIRDDFEVNAFGLLATTRAFAPVLARARRRRRRAARRW